ncbi:hypothetical protein JTB14_000863 [Gonioctena quinquepunctata]|nr:hypothetical protein JTB14_000863 [Gonioctena quinquepunctata]
MTIHFRKHNAAEVQNYFMQVDRLLRDLGEACMKLDETDMICILLLTIPEKFEVVITAIGTITTKVSMDFVKSRLLDTILKSKGNNTDTADSNFGFGASNSEFRRGKCFRCHQWGHIKRNYPKFPIEMKRITVILKTER